MKNTLLSCALLIFVTSIAQESFTTSCISGDSRNNLGLTTEQMSMAIEGNRQAIGKIEGLSSIVDFSRTSFAKSIATGSSMLYTNWNNSGTIQVSGENYSVDNLNYSIKDGLFYTKMKDEKVIALDFKGIERITVNKDIFKVYYHADINAYRVFQVMYEDPEFSILKGFDLKIVEGSPNPMLNRNSNQIKKKELLFVKQNSSINRLKGNKRKINKYIADDNRLALAEMLNINISGYALASND